MAKFPREEVSYKKIYKNLDLDRDLGINWPEDKIEKRDFIEIKETINLEKINFLTFDEKFYNENLLGKIDKKDFVDYFTKINSNFNKYLLNKINKEVTRETPCDVCGYSDPEEDNLLITCQGCGISAHQNCYGFERENNWICTKCIYYFEDEYCKFCNCKDGLLKQTTDGDWIHVTCALLHPKIDFKNSSFREPVEINDFEFLEGNCDCCKNPCKALIKCSYESCQKYFDCSCAISTLYCDIDNKRVYCKKHDPTNNDLLFLSRNNTMENLCNYLPLENEIFERESIPHCKRIDTDYSIATSTEPFIILDGYVGILLNLENEKFKNIIDNYFIERRKAYGTYFEDPFMLANKILNK